MKKVWMAKEKEFRQLFPDCEVEAIVHLGNLYNLEVQGNKALIEDNSIVFKAGSHVEAF